MLGLKNIRFYFLLLPLIALLSCNACNARVLDARSQKSKNTETEKPSYKILTGAEQTAKYLPLLTGKRVGLVVNQTAEINGIPLVDTLKSLAVNIKAIFGPEHGFRGNADAGETVGNY